MIERRGFSYDTVYKALMNMRLGVKPAYRVSDHLSDEDIDRALRSAYSKVFGGKSCQKK